MLSDAFPSWICTMAERQGISTTINVLRSMGDAQGRALYLDYAATLQSWGTTTPGQPSTASLTPLNGQFVGLMSLPIAGKGTATNP
jgi:hypothetical protein